jgi:16S rRNA (uracil1498-N3)-methyltransferase
MRAHWVSSLEIEEQYTLKGDELHHLVNVIRIEKGEPLLLLNGKGLIIETRVEMISKREMILTKIGQRLGVRQFEFDLALGMPKREALELCLKEATELGFRRVYLIKSDFSQMRFPDKERTEKLLISALEQSNAPFLPEVIFTEWREIPFNRYKRVLLLDSQTPAINSQGEFLSGSEELLIVGPEGGFSSSEIQFLHSQSNIKVVNLPTPILRSPTAVAAGAGIMIESLLK